MSDDIDEIVDNLREPSAWIRILFMVGFALGMYLVIAPIVVVLMIVQALFSVLAGEPNYNLRRFGGALGEYVLEILQFLTYNSHDKPFPFSDFPALEDEEAAGSGADKDGGAGAKSAASKSSGKSAAAKKKSAAKKPARKKSATRKTAAKKQPAKQSRTDKSSEQSGDAPAGDTGQSDSDGADTGKPS